MLRIAKVFGAAVALVVFEPMAQARVTIDIDLTSQTMRVAADSGETYVWPISSGRAGHLTPTGRYRPQRLYAMVHSLKYDNAPMPQFDFLSRRLRHSRQQRGRHARAPRLAWLHPAGAGQRERPVRSGEEAGRGDLDFRRRAGRDECGCDESSPYEGRGAGLCPASARKTAESLDAGPAGAVSPLQQSTKSFVAPRGELRYQAIAADGPV
jgi:L,D-transpeptidase catalytic domain